MAKGKVECRVCGKQFGRITASHVKTHGLTYQEYLKKYESKEYEERQEQQAVIDFFNEFYITVRYKFLKYLPSREGRPITVDTYRNKEINKNDGSKLREYPLTETDLKAHLEGGETIGIFFPKGYTKVIGLDLDVLDVDLLYRLTLLLKSYGLHEKNVLISSSGGKGFHVDIFLSNLLPRDIADNFHQAILEALNVDKSIIELRGGTSEQGYKLPLGVHFGTGSFCDICDSKGVRVQDYLKVLRTREKADINVITTAARSFYEPQQTDEDLHEADEIITSWNSLPTYSNTEESRIETIKQLMKNGLHEKGNRNWAIYNVAMYLKDFEGLCIAEAKEKMLQWITSKWSRSIVDSEVLTNLGEVLKSVYRNNSHIIAGAREITISDNDVREILTVKTGNKLQTRALRRLYFALAIHFNVYADKTGVFYMTYEQMAQAGLGGNRQRLKDQLEKLVELGKVRFVRENERQGKGFKSLPNKYFLPSFVQYQVRSPKEEKTFKMCEREQKCSNCLERAFCHLLPARERAKHIKGKEYKEIQKCPYNG